MKIKNWTREYISRLIARKPDEICEMICNSSWKAVSFDVFDTLLKRNVPSPSDVFIHAVGKAFLY